MALLPCQNCGAMISNTALACPKCRAERSSDTPPRSDTSADEPLDNRESEHAVRLIGSMIALAALIALVIGIANMGPGRSPIDGGASDRTSIRTSAVSSWTTSAIDQKTAQIEEDTRHAKAIVDRANLGPIENAQKLAIAANNGDLGSFERSSRNDVRRIGDLSKVYSQQSGMLLFDTPTYSFWGYILQNEVNVIAEGRYQAPGCQFEGRFFENVEISIFSGIIYGSGDGRGVTVLGNLVPYRRTAAGFLAPEQGLPVGDGTADLRFAGLIEYGDGAKYVGEVFIPQGDCSRVMRDGVGAYYSAGAWQKGEFAMDRLVRTSRP